MPPPLILGWEEWVALPALGLAALKAKIDSGARTSALHAREIEPFGTPDQPRLRFRVHPAPGRKDLEIVCDAPLVGFREVASSNGERERRAVIATPIAIGQRVWTIEVTLTDRATMRSRMLIGRQALREGVLIDPGNAFLQPRLSYRLYGKR